MFSAGLGRGEAGSGAGLQVRISGPGVGSLPGHRGRWEVSQTLRPAYEKLIKSFIQDLYLFILNRFFIHVQ